MNYEKQITKNELKTIIPVKSFWRQRRQDLLPNNFARAFR